MQKFKKGDFVKTNIHYCKGWNDCPAPRGMKRIKKGEVVKVINLDDMEKHGRGENYLYTIKTKSTEKLINQCFLEKA